MSAIPSNKVNMSLDDIIKQSRKSKGGRGNKFNKGRRNFGERRRYNQKSNIRAATEEGAERRTRLFVSNLQKDIVNSELRKIFSQVGALKKCAIHWDDLGFSKGTADVQYEKPEDAQKAIKDYNEAEIEGVTMKVEYAKSAPRDTNKFSRPKTGGRRNEERRTRGRNPNVRGRGRGERSANAQRERTRPRGRDMTGKNNVSNERNVRRPRKRLGGANRNLK